MKRIKDEAEVIVRLDYVDQLAHITVHAWPSMATKMEKRYGPSLDGQSEQSRRWRVPLNRISFRKASRSARERIKTPVLASGVPVLTGSSHATLN